MKISVLNYSQSLKGIFQQISLTRNGTVWYPLLTFPVDAPSSDCFSPGLTSPNALRFY
jgi:hypothetical protein